MVASMPLLGGMTSRVGREREGGLTNGNWNPRNIAGAQGQAGRCDLPVLFSDGHLCANPGEQQACCRGEIINFVADAFYIAVTVLFYFLFKPVSRTLSLVAACLSLAGCVVMILGQLHLAPARFSPLIFFGPFCILIGYLIIRSTFLPRVLGVLMVLAGAAWLIYLVPSLPHLLTVSIEGLGILAEGALMLWLLAAGVKVERWKEQAAARTGS